MIDYKAIGRRLMIHRKNNNLTQAEIAEKLNVSSKYISALERGVKKISLSLLSDFADIFQIDAADLIRCTDDSSNTYGNQEILDLIQDWDYEKKSMLIQLLIAYNSACDH